MLLRPFPLIAFTALALVVPLLSPALGQDSPRPSAPPGVDRGPQSQNYRLIHVNAVSGNDGSGDGSQFRPLQSITHALQQATPNSIILLAPGEYSAENGENFPIVLRSAVTIQGAVAPGMEATIIRGNGTFVNASGTYMQATLIGVDGAGLGHVTVTNPSSSGHGLVVESGSPVIRANHFINNGYAGAYVGGTASPLFEDNLFSNNGFVGLVLAGQSRAAVQGNIFENTGTGIQIDPGAEPQISNNRIISNRQGIVVAAEAQPQLQNNEIARNRQNGLVEFAAANKTVNPAAASSPLNTPRPLLQGPPPVLEATPVQPTEAPPAANGGLSLAPPPQNPMGSLAAPPQPGADQPLAAPTPGIAGDIPDDSGVTASTGTSASENVTAASRVEPANFPTELPADFNTGNNSENLPLSLSLATASLATALALTDRGTVRVSQATAREVSHGATALLEETPGENSPAPWAEPDIQDGANSSDTDAASTTAPPAAALASPAPDTESSVSATAMAVPLQVIPPSVETPDGAAAMASPADNSPASETPLATARDQPQGTRFPSPPQVDSSSSALLQVPEGQIPTGTGSSSNVPVLATGAFPGNPAAAAPPPPPSRAAMLGLLYRVVVPASGETIQHQVRSLVPDAFRVEVNDQLMMQAGAYPTRAEAEAMVAELQGLGLDAEVLYIP